VPSKTGPSVSLRTLTNASKAIPFFWAIRATPSSNCGGLILRAALSLTLAKKMSISIIVSALSIRSASLATLAKALPSISLYGAVYLPNTSRRVSCAGVKGACAFWLWLADEDSLPGDGAEISGALESDGPSRNGLTCFRGVAMLPWSSAFVP